MKIARSLFALALLAAPACAQGPLVHGHRGCRARRPENTLAAFAQAIRVGADVLELDMNVTKDGVIVVSHNMSIPPEICLGPDGKPAVEVPIRELTLRQVKSYDCGSLRNPRFPDQVPVPGERIPTLEEVFQLVKNSKEPGARSVQLNIETKIVPGKPELAPAPKDFARLVVELVQRYDLTSRVILQSFDDRTLVAAKKLSPNLRLSLLTSDNHLDYVAAARAIGAQIVSPDQRWILAEDVAALHKADVQVAPWTVDDEADWKRMIDIGADAIITDDPEALIAYLKRLGLR